jgi:hypothetical protein
MLTTLVSLLLLVQHNMNHHPGEIPRQLCSDIQVVFNKIGHDKVWEHVSNLDESKYPVEAMLDHLENVDTCKGLGDL